MGDRVVVIGAGFGGLSAAALLARQGHQVTVVEKNDHAGGRAMVWEKDGYRFDMGPSWYLMPDVFDRFFAQMGTSTPEQLDLRRLEPSYRIYFGPGDIVDVPADRDRTLELFDTFEEDGARKLEAYLERAAYQYDVAMQEFIYRRYSKLTDFFSRRMLTEGRKLNVFTNLDKHVRSYFDSDRARKVLEYSMVFLGGAPNNTPSLYSIMSHVDLTLGVWYPSGGMSAVAEAIKRLAEAEGARFMFDCPVSRILVRNGSAAGVEANGQVIEADTVVSAADYHHVDTELLDKKHREYSDSYWRSRVVAPSAMVLFLGLNRPIESLEHHTLFLARDWMEHFNAIFDQPEWPSNPSYYVCVPSKTDAGAAPEGCENLFVLVPVAAGLEDTPEGRRAFADMILDDLEAQIGEPIREHIVVYRDFAHRDFASLYNAYKGTALGLAHTLRQTAIFRPRQESKKVKGLYHVGQYVHPGIGVPMTLISSQIAAGELEP